MRAPYDDVVRADRGRTPARLGLAVAGRDEFGENGDSATEAGVRGGTGARCSLAVRDFGVAGAERSEKRLRQLRKLLSGPVLMSSVSSIARRSVAASGRSGDITTIVLVLEDGGDGATGARFANNEYQRSGQQESVLNLYFGR